MTQIVADNIGPPGAAFGAVLSVNSASSVIYVAMAHRQLRNPPCFEVP